MNGFDERKDKSELAIQRFDAYCRDHSIIFAKSGYEDMASDNGNIFKEKIRSLDSETAKRLRFFPDRVVLFKDATLVEIKNSKYIEKDAYDTYSELDRIGYRVGIVFLYSGLLVFCMIKDLKLSIPSNNGIPIVEQYFLAPRLLTHSEYSEWKQTHHGSGTAFGVVDFITTIWIELK